MNKIKISLIFLLILISILLTNRAKAQIATSTAPTSTPTGTEVTLPSIPVVISQVKEAKQILESVVLNHELLPVYKKNTKTLLRYNIGNKDIALAIWDPATGKIITTIGRLKGKTMIFPDPAVDVKLVRFNGVNSKFEINQPAGGKILALKYLISNPDSGSKAKIEAGLYSSIYVPYSLDFSEPEVTAYGSNYLNGIISAVAAELKYLPSNSMPGKELVEAIPPALIKALVYAEHTDTAQVLYSNNTQTSIDQLNILFALNEGDTYKYSVSSAGARGIAQFMPGTYKGLVERHPEAGLIKDFVEGMSDHKNSIKAMYLLLDDYAGTVRVKAATGFAEGRVFEYGAASYNGGTTRVARAVNTFGTAWDQDYADLKQNAQARVNSLTAQVKNLKTKIKAASDKTEKSKLQAQLSLAQSELSETTVKLASYKSSTLRNETVNYLKKIYKVIQFFNDQPV